MPPKKSRDSKAAKNAAPSAPAASYNPSSDSPVPRISTHSPLLPDHPQSSPYYGDSSTYTTPAPPVATSTPTHAALPAPPMPPASSSVISAGYSSSIMPTPGAPSSMYPHSGAGSRYTAVEVGVPDSIPDYSSAAAASSPRYLGGGPLPGAPDSVDADFGNDLVVAEAASLTQAQQEAVSSKVFHLKVLLPIHVFLLVFLVYTPMWPVALCAYLLLLAAAGYWHLYHLERAKAVLILLAVSGLIWLATAGALVYFLAFPITRLSWDWSLSFVATAVDVVVIAPLIMYHSFWLQRSYGITLVTF